MRRDDHLVGDIRDDLRVEPHVRKRSAVAGKPAHALRPQVQHLYCENIAAVVTAFRRCRRGFRRDGSRVAGPRVGPGIVVRRRSLRFRRRIRVDFQRCHIQKRAAHVAFRHFEAPEHFDEIAEAAIVGRLVKASPQHPERILLLLARRIVVGLIETAQPRIELLRLIDQTAGELLRFERRASTCSNRLTRYATPPSFSLNALSHTLSRSLKCFWQSAD